MELKNQKINEIVTVLSRHLMGKSRALKLSLIAMFSKGHLLIEDLPGLGKTTLAISIAKALQLSFGRIQCTNDLLPSDITGFSVYDRASGSFQFHPGPLFNNIVLVDEINRATPKTQSALLEAMGEKQTTIEGRTYQHPQPFFIMATQNPAEHFGAFPLPESQLDRFTMKISIGYPSKEAEKEILKSGDTKEGAYTIEPIMSSKDVIDVQEDIRRNVYTSDRILEYILEIVKATRNNKYIFAGISTRGALSIVHTAKTNAYFNGRDFVIPEDIKELSEYTMPHRIVFREEYENSDRKEIIKSIISRIPQPI